MNNGEAQPVNLSTRVALSVSEAATALGISEAHLRRHLPDVPHMHLGGRVLFPIADLQAWLSQRARTEKRGAEQAAAEILASLGD